MMAALVVVTVFATLLVVGEYLAPRCPRVDRVLHVALGGGSASWTGEDRDG